MNQASQRRALRAVSGCIAGCIALAAAINAYSYAMVSAIPLVQSDVWVYLDGFLGRFIEQGFSVGALFYQPFEANTNQIVHKLFLFFHTRYFGMDFRLEGLFGTLCGIGSALVIARAASGRALAAWGTRELWLLAFLGLALLSLNSTNVFTWPLVTMWFLALLIAVCYMAAMLRFGDRAWVPVVATFVLGVLQDEVSYPVIASTLLAALLVGGPRDARVRRLWLGAVAGLAASRVVYWIAAVAQAQLSAPLRDVPPMTRLLAADAWKAVTIPATDGVVHRSNLEPLFGPAATAMLWGIGIVVLCAHAWFWARVLLPSARAAVSASPRATALAAAIMLFFYALLAGIALQRVPDFGYKYFNQPRYVIFYQLQLAALAVMAYRDFGAVPAGSRRSAAGALLVCLVLVFTGLQFRLSTLAWDHAKYLSSYVSQAALTMGRLSQDPAMDIPCADILMVCDFPPAKRQELIDRLIRYRLNLFSPDFQAFHRLYPVAPQAPPPPVAAAPAAPATPAAGVPGD